VKDADDQALNDGLGLGPVDGHRESAHENFVPSQRPGGRFLLSLKGIAGGAGVFRLCLP
jgi:hypothetical protein